MTKINKKSRAKTGSGTSVLTRGQSEHFWEILLFLLGYLPILTAGHAVGVAEEA